MRSSQCSSVHKIFSVQMIFPLRSAFIALPLEGDAKNHFRVFQEALKEHEEILSFQNPASPHLTLQFWLSMMEIEYHQILKQAEAVAGKAEPFSLKIEGVETFGDKGRDRVLFLSVPFSEPLARLKKLCPWPSEKQFHPHITLARIRHPERFTRVKKRVMKLLDDASFDMHVDRLRLYAEIDGRKQTMLQDFLFP